MQTASEEQQVKETWFPENRRECMGQDDGPQWLGFTVGKLWESHLHVMLREVSKEQNKPSSWKLRGENVSYWETDTWEKGREMWIKHHGVHVRDGADTRLWWRLSETVLPCGLDRRALRVLAAPACCYTRAEKT